ncbi:MAG: glycosyltransferase [Puniceicoccales bacterium]|jgi:glycosyltransferase involved in cell wall biosynthesis|nr:glycosyltransferase [Puniceicoccales bacterium]
MMDIWIVQVGEPISFADGGSRPFRAEMLTNRLIERGHTVTIWTSTFDHLRKAFRFCNQQEIVVSSQLRYIFLAGKSHYRKSLSWANRKHNRQLAIAFEKMASRKQPPDLILCIIPPLPLAAAVSKYAHRRNIPLIADVHDTWPTSFVKNLSPILQRIGHFLLRHEWQRAKQILHHAAGIVTTSKYDSRWAFKQADRRRHLWDAVFPLAYEDPPQTAFASDETRMECLQSIGAVGKKAIVTCVGRVGSAFDFKVVTQLADYYYRNSSSDIHFVLAGEKPVYRFWEKPYKIPPNLKVTGWLDQQGLNAILAVTDIGLLPYRAIHSAAIRNKPLDFLSHGIPLVSSLSGELAQLIEGCQLGFTCQGGDVAAFRRALDELVGNTELRNSMRANGLALFKDKFSAQKVYGRFADYLENFYSKCPTKISKA